MSKSIIIDKVNGNVLGSEGNVSVYEAKDALDGYATKKGYHFNEGDFSIQGVEGLLESDKVSINDFFDGSIDIDKDFEFRVDLDVEGKSVSINLFK